MALAAEVLPASPDVMEMRTGLSAEEVRRRLAGSARREDTDQRVHAFYLVEMDARRLYQETGHGSTVDYAVRGLGRDRRRTAELLRVGRKLMELHETDRAFREGRLSWTKMLVLARVAVPEHEAAWLERALALDVRALTLLASRSRQGGPPRRPGDEKGLPEIRFPLGVSLPPLEHALHESVQRRLSAELGREVDGVEMLRIVYQEFLGAPADGTQPGRKRVDASAFRVVLTEVERGGPLHVQTEDGPVPIDTGGSTALSECARCDAGARNEDGHDHRARDIKTPPAMRARVIRRDGHRCRSCRARRSLMVHHVEFRSHGGRTLPQNLITVCARCHGLVHEGLLVIEGACAEGARFLDAQRRPLAHVEPGAPIEMPPAAPAPAPEPDLVTLASIPAEVDATWWRRHAHLVRERCENGSLRFGAGVPNEAPEPSTAPTLPTLSPEEGFELRGGGPRSPSLEGLVGQDERIARLRRALAAAEVRRKALPHVLLTGPAGTGKTTLARGFAAEARRPFVEASAPLLVDRVAWVRLLAGLPEGCVLFLDEAHVLPRSLQDVLLQAMAERRLVLALTDGTISRQVALRLPTFTLVAATTNEGALSPALRSRFALREKLARYRNDALAQVVLRGAAGEPAELTQEGALRLARASRGTPREALGLLERALDDAALDGTTRLDVPAVERTLARLGYDAEDHDATEQEYLETLRASQVPIPLARMACMMGTTSGTLAEHVEPRLFARGLVRTTPSGRMALPSLRWGRTASGPHLRRAAVEGAGAEAGAPNVRQTSAAAFASP